MIGIVSLVTVISVHLHGVIGAEAFGLLRVGQTPLTAYQWMLVLTPGVLAGASAVLRRRLPG